MAASVTLVPIGGVVDADTQVTQQAIGHIIDPAMHGQILPATPGVLDNGRLADMANLLHNIQLAQAVHLRLFGIQRLQQWRVNVPDVLDMAQPVIDQPQALIKQAARTPPQP